MKSSSKEVGSENSCCSTEDTTWLGAESGKEFDLAVVVSFGYFLPRSLIRSFPQGAINVHPSLLPKYRGAAPIQHTILNDEKETGVSIIELDYKAFDAGRILKQTTMEVPPLVFYKDLHDKLAARGAADLVSVLERLADYKRSATVQDETKVSHARKIDKTMAQIFWDAMTADQVYRLHRALGYKVPVYTHFRKRRTQLMALEEPLKPDDIPFSAPADVGPGTLYFDKQRQSLFVRCKDTWIGCRRIKMETKKEVDVIDFVNGYKLGPFKDMFYSQQ
ncbi:hypothetical protein HK102_003588 [Quaeritorhiza haematococci]|nr:hypothetical protein HK102_003588 [Quaeritorhiza haematococci]